MLSVKEMAPREVTCWGYWVDAEKCGCRALGLYNLFALEGVLREPWGKSNNSSQDPPNTGVPVLGSKISVASRPVVLEVSDCVGL